MDHKEEKNNRIFFGIRGKMRLAIGLIVTFVLLVSFILAVYLHIALSISDAIDLDIYSANMIARNIDPLLTTKVLTRGMEIYESIPEEIRKNRDSKEYLSYFDSLRDEDYETLLAQLKSYKEFENVKWIDLRLGDSQNERWVCLMDTDMDDEEQYAPGYWEYGNETVSTFRGETEEEKMQEASLWKPLRAINDIRYLNVNNIERFCATVDYYDPETGELIGYVGVGEEYEDYREELSAFWMLHLIALVVLLVVVFIISDFIITRSLVHPMLKLSAASQAYIADKDKTKNTQYFQSVQIKSHDEVRLLRDSMVDMEVNLAHFMRDLEHMTAEKERVSVEMDLSARIQTSLLPNSLENYNGEQSFAIHALIDPAKDVGGDFYDYYVIDDDHIALTIADVSDKGVPAALFMVVTKTLLHTTGMKYKEPSTIMETVNRMLYNQNPEMMFVTVFFAIYTISEKKLTYVNAGHDDPVVYKAATGEFSLVEEENDFVMAVMPDTEYKDRTFYFASGDKQFLYTDGVPEANNMKKEMFDFERMLNGLNEQKGLSGEEFLKKMRQRVADFAGEAPQFDDVTMLLLEVL